MVDAANRRVVLYVDDDEPSRLLMARVFARHRPHDELMFAASVAEAVGRARETTPDLVVLDLTLPDGSGEDLLRILKRDYAVPVIIFSGYGDETTRRRLIEQGADAYVAKPMDFHELMVAIRSVVGPASAGEP